MQNGFAESFNGRMRDELLNETLFFDLDDARAKIANWIADYNLQRPHSSLKYLTPAAYAAHLTATDDRLRNLDQLRRSPVAPPAPLGLQNPETLCRWMKPQWQVTVFRLGWPKFCSDCNRAAASRPQRDARNRWFGDV